jgi:hypothetical protein
MSQTKADGYTLARKWYEFVGQRQDVNPAHHALFLWLVQLRNRAKWAETFELPTKDSMKAIGIKGVWHL